MARNAGVSVENNFVNGLVTEATGLNFPENAVTETWNCVFDKTGTVRRRTGIDLETGYLAGAVPTDPESVYVEYVWESVGGDGDISFLVQQIGPILYFYRNTSAGAISAQFINALSLASQATVYDTRLFSGICQFAAGLGYLVVTHPYCHPFYITFTGVGFAATRIDIKTRDFRGVEPHPLGRATEISNQQQYNLRNQGWSAERLAEYRSKAGFYPSDYEVWWLYKRPDQYGNEVFLPTDIYNWQSALSNLDRGNSPAPRGSVILDEFYQDRSGVTGIGGLPVVSSGLSRPATSAFHAGRVFYSGVQAADGYSSKIYFSQIIEQTNQFGKCYQENDPTSQYSPDLLANDGGVISIPDAGTIFKLWSTDNSLLVFASEGVWQITGSSGIGFSAVDYTVKRISSVNTASILSFVDVDGMPLWWGKNGIYIAAVNTQLGGISIQSISDDKIKSYYQSISELGKSFGKGSYNDRERKVQWLHRIDNLSAGQEQVYSHVLNLDIDTKAFYPWTLPQGPGFIRGIVALKGVGSSIAQENVVDNLGVDVTDSIGNVVTVSRIVSAPLATQFKYTTTFSGFTYAYANETTSAVDWETLGAVNSPAYFVSGYRIRGDAIKDQQNNYLNIFGLTNPPSEIVVNGQWGYSTTAASNRWSVPQQVRFNHPQYSVTNKKLKIRGHGLVLQYRVESVGTEGFEIIGWSSQDSANASV